MMTSTMSSPPVVEAAVWRCLFCNNEQTKEDFDREPLKILFGRDIYNKSKDNLETQLSHFFMLRNVLGLPTEFLEELLKEHGSPASWNIQLCRACNRVFTEAEYLWEKIKGMQKEFEKVTFDIKDLLVNSISPEEGEALVKYADDLDAHKTVIKEQMKSHQVPVLETVRATFFLCLHEQSNENEVGNNKSRRPPTGRFRVNRNKAKSKLDWHQTGIPFLALADFENKIKDFGEMLTSMTKVTATASSVGSISDSSKNLSEPKNVVVNDDDDDDDVITILDDSSQSSGKLSTSSAIRPNSKGPAPQKQRQISHEEEDEDPEEPAIRIVNTSSLMEREEDDDDGEQEAEPQVMRIVKQDIHDTVVEEYEDPLSPCSDKNDPDYAPDNVPDPFSPRSRASTASSENGTVRNPENHPSRLKFRGIVPVKNGRNFQCSKCSAEFEARSGCQSHILRDHYGERQAFHCHICSAKFELHRQIIDHVFKAHGHSRSPYDDGFNPETDFVRFKRHNIDSVRDTAEDGPTESKTSKEYFGPRYECPVLECGSSFEYKSKLNQHAKTVHDINLKGLSTNVKFQSDSSCNSDSNNQGHRCKICAEKGILFKALSRDILDIHLKMRHGVVRSNSEASTSSSPISVRRTTDKPKQKKKIVAKKKITAKLQPPIVVKRPSTMKCPDCQLVLPTASAVVEHLKNPDNKCPDCSKHFLFDMDLKRHLELDHAGRRAFQCPYCPKSFSAQTIYEKHIDNHQQFDMHECEVCHIKLTGFATLTNHMETQHAFHQQQMQPDPEIFGI